MVSSEMKSGGPITAYVTGALVVPLVPTALANVAVTVSVSELVVVVASVGTMFAERGMS